MKRLFLLLFAAVWIPAALSAQKTYHPSLEGEFICDVNDWTPADVALSGSAQGFAIHGRYCVLVRDKGMCSIYDMKRKPWSRIICLKGMNPIAIMRLSGKKNGPGIRCSPCSIFPSAGEDMPVL